MENVSYAKLRTSVIIIWLGKVVSSIVGVSGRDDSFITVTSMPTTDVASYKYARPLCLSRNRLGAKQWAAKAKEQGLDAITAHGQGHFVHLLPLRSSEETKHHFSIRQFRFSHQKCLLVFNVQSQRMRKKKHTHVTFFDCDSLRLFEYKNGIQ